MEDDPARLSVTDRPAPFRFENLGSWASLDDGDAFASACHVTLSGHAVQRKLQSVAGIRRKIWEHMRHQPDRVHRKWSSDQTVFDVHVDAGLIGKKCHADCHGLRS